MLKIYFDWNCITHSKNIYPYILNIAEECGDRFIFPFSNAHIRDLMVSHNKENKYFDSDLDLLERICTKHYLLFEVVSQGQVIDILIIGAFFNSYSLQYYSFWKGKIGFARTVPVSWTTPMSIASVTVDS